MNWRDFISDAYTRAIRAPGIAAKPAFQPPASIADVAALQTHFELTIPVELRSILLESNGVMSLLKIDDGVWFDDMWLFWPVSKIIDQNCHLRQATMHPYDDNRRYCDRADELLFFADDGGDGIFAHPINEGIVESGVIVWTPIGDELTPIASSLKDFVQGSLTGQLPHY